MLNFLSDNSSEIVTIVVGLGSGLFAYLLIRLIKKQETRIGAGALRRLQTILTDIDDDLSQGRGNTAKQKLDHFLAYCKEEKAERFDWEKVATEIRQIEG